jgi:hypothetical protein
MVRTQYAPYEVDGGASLTRGCERHWIPAFAGMTHPGVLTRLVRAPTLSPLTRLSSRRRPGPSGFWAYRPTTSNCATPCDTQLS